MWVLTPPEPSSLVDSSKIFYFNHLGNIKKMKKSPARKSRGLFVTMIISSPRLLGGRSAWPDPLLAAPATFHVNTSNPQACLINHTSPSLRNKVHVTRRTMKGPLSQDADQTKLTCLSHPSSCNLLSVP